MHPESWPEWLNRTEASDYLKNRFGIRLKPCALARHAVNGTGPVFFKDGRRVVYAIADLNAWALVRMRRCTSTRDAREVRAAA
jgi:hypothetical protein